MELPIYSKNMDHPITAATMNAVVVNPPRSPPGTRSRAVTVVRVVPYDTAQERMTEQNDSSIQGIAETLSILIVDDSTANRSRSLMMITSEGVSLKYVTL